MTLYQLRPCNNNAGIEVSVSQASKLKLQKLTPVAQSPRTEDTEWAEQPDLGDGKAGALTTELRWSAVGTALGNGPAGLCEPRCAATVTEQGDA